MTSDEFRSRASVILLGRGWQVRLARATGRSYAAVRNWSSGRVPVPPETVALLEFLEAVPRDRWPGRWVAVLPPHRTMQRRAKAS